MAGGTDLSALPEIQYLTSCQGISQSTIGAAVEEHSVAGAVSRIICDRATACIDWDAGRDHIGRSRADEHQPIDDDGASAARGPWERGDRGDCHQARRFVVGGGRDAVVGGSDGDRATADVLVIRAGEGRGLGEREGVGACAGVLDSEQPYLMI